MIFEEGNNKVIKNILVSFLVFIFVQFIIVFIFSDMRYFYLDKYFSIRVAGVFIGIFVALIIHTE
jgi:hypothetical protein